LTTRSPAKTIVVDAIQAGMAPRTGARVALIDQHLKLSIEGLEIHFFAQEDSRLYDLLVVAAAIDFCDLTTSRPGLGWMRRFDLQIAVHDPGLWSSPDVADALNDVVRFLTGDHWSVSFVARASSAVRVMDRGLELPAAASMIMPFSDGLDSRAVAALIGAQQQRMLRVRLGREGRDQRLPGRRTEAFMAVPYEVKVPKRERRESSARSRGLKFAAITGIAAHLANVKTIVVTESGQGALGPTLAVAGQAYPDYRVHPRFSRKMERLFATLMGRAPEYVYPRLWSTKAETLAAAAKLSDPPMLSETRSCWQGSRQVGVNGKRRQCGVCAACLLRRQSLHAAGLSDPKEAYVWEDLSATTFRGGAAAGFDDRINGAHEEYAIAGVLHLDHLAALPDSPLYEQLLRRNARQIAVAVEDDPTSIEAKLLDLLRRHRAEWQAFLAALGPRSFISKLASVVP
jgi:7-cyano-7-deazaguanine synthase in queuosine biosynthesis